MIRRRKFKRILEGVEDAERPFLKTGGGHDPSDGSDPVAEAIARARQEGLAEGRREALEAFEKEVDAFRQEMAATLKRLVQLEVSMTRQHESLLLEAALEASSRIVRERIDSGDPVAARALKEAMDVLPVSAGLRARLHPDDLEATAKDLEPEVEGGRIELVPDASVSRGGCIVESAVGTVDATIETAREATRAAAIGDEENA